jgi:hypothetical protein
MPDGFDALTEVELAALEEARAVLGLLHRLEALRAGVEDDPEYEMIFKARIELTLMSAGWERALSEDVIKYLSGFVRSPRLEPDEPAQAEAPAQNTKRKRRPPNRKRDRILVSVIDRIVNKYGFSATRRQQRRESACSIVAKVLEELDRKCSEPEQCVCLNERGVEEVWDARNRQNTHSAIVTS